MSNALVRIVHSTNVPILKNTNRSNWPMYYIRSS